MFGILFASVFFGIWALLSILVLWRKPGARIRAWDAFGLIPQWRFFAPVPSTSDYFVLYRDIFPNGSFTDWTELRAFPRHWWNGMFFPAKRERKSEIDAAMQLGHLDWTGPHIDRATSIPYLAILNRVTRIKRWVVPESTQFAVAIVDLRADEPKMQIFCVSGLHRLK